MMTEWEKHIFAAYDNMEPGEEQRGDWEEEFYDRADREYELRLDMAEWRRGW